MSNPSIGLRLSKEAVAALERKCSATGKSRTQVIEDWLLSLDNADSTVEGSTNKADSSKCEFSVGQKLPVNFQLKEHLTQKTALQPWLVFPEDRVVAVKASSTNGNKRWLEVVATYPDAAWENAPYSRDWHDKPVTALVKATEEQAELEARVNHPKFKEAVAAGWRRYYSLLRSGSLAEFIREAEIFLAEQAALVPSTEESAPSEEVAPTIEPVNKADKIPVTLGSTAFRERYGLTDQAYGMVRNQANRGKYWLGSDGISWTVVGKGGNAIWSSRLPAEMAVKYA